MTKNTWTKQQKQEMTTLAVVTGIFTLFLFLGFKSEMKQQLNEQTTEILSSVTVESLQPTPETLPTNLILPLEDAPAESSLVDIEEPIEVEEVTEVIEILAVEEDDDFIYIETPYAFHGLSYMSRDDWMNGSTDWIYGVPEDTNGDGEINVSDIVTVLSDDDADSWIKGNIVVTEDPELPSIPVIELEAESVIELPGIPTLTVVDEVIESDVVVDEDTESEYYDAWIAEKEFSGTNATLDTFIWSRQLEKNLNPKRTDWTNMNHYVAEGFDEYLAGIEPKENEGDSYSTASHDDGTDNLTFNEAFRHYRTKLGAEKLFVWRNHFYTTDKWTDSKELFDEEMENFADKK